MTKQSKKNPLIPIFILLAAVIVLGALSFEAFNNIYMPTMIPNKQNEVLNTKMIPFNFASQKITVNNEVMSFTNGTFADLSSGDNATIGERTLNPAGTKAAAILVDSPGGSGIFYYVIAASLVNGTETYSQPVLLGDRIKFDSMTVSDDGIILVNYLDRGKNDPMSTEPTKKVTAKFAFQDNGDLISVLH